MAEQNLSNTQADTEPNGGNNAQGGGINSSEKTYTQQELDNIVIERTSRAARSALSSFFKQRGLSEDEANTAMNEYLESKKSNTPDVAKLQRDITAANTARLQAEINQSATLEAIKQGVDVKSIPYVLKMASFDGVTDNDGKITPEKLSEAVKKVLDDVPALKASTEPIKTAVLGTSGGASSNPLASIRKAMGLPTDKK